ncbi:MAG: DEAD/DEAH box helicase family protein [Candidatus Izemoplasmatales bacterium]
MINQKILPEYSVNRIENIMSLRIPQKQSLKILDTILDEFKLSKDEEVDKISTFINDMYPIFKGFEHNFMSLAFALATGVGKTKLMGAFITYLYTNKNIRNFFVVAPNLTIYDKLKNDLGNPSESNEKYVFKGVSCFAVKEPNVWIDDDYRNRPARSLTDSDSINIYIFNISKFNSEDRKISDVNEYLGESFIDYLKSMEDLVLIMDESHHYRAKASFEAINDLNPVLGLELTATPQVQVNSKTKYFENVVYEYPLSKAIRDGYTRTPYAMTRQDFQSYNLDEDELDRLMINDGIKHHEIMKEVLKQYSINNDLKIVKPFMLIVCKNTPHANKVMKYIKSDAFKFGKYKNKAIMIHSKQRGEEKEENIRLLLEVEKASNPVEIVIHVNILKEGWDVNNLYTIVPLRTATSKTLREQTVGRGLRLPYGVRTGNSEVDSVTITAHDKFNEIIEEAQSSDSIFNKGGVIYAETEKEVTITQTKLNLTEINSKKKEVFEKLGIDVENEKAQTTYQDIISRTTQLYVEEKKATYNSGKVDKKSIKESLRKDYAETFKDNTDDQRLFDLIISEYMDDTIDELEKKTMFIPKIKTEDFGEEEYIIQDFDLDMSNMKYVPQKNDILYKNLIDVQEKSIRRVGDNFEIESFISEKRLVDHIRQIAEIDYEKCSEIIQKVVIQFLEYYRGKYSEDDVRNIILSYQRDIIDKFKNQLLNHWAVKYNDILETVSEIETVIYGDALDRHADTEIKNIYEPSGENNIKSLIYDGAKKAVKTPYKFDSEPERKFAVVCEESEDVLQWLRPAAKQFNITYNRGKRYQPDFVVEDKDTYYLVEVKSRKELNDPIVLAKKDRAIKYCSVASAYNTARGYKPFKYLFIPHDEIELNTSFTILKNRFIEE